MKLTTLKPKYLSQVVFGMRCLVSFSAMAVEAKADSQGALAKPFVTVNGLVQTTARAELLLREQLGRGATVSNELRLSVRDTLISLALMEQQARSAGLDKDALVQAQVELARQNILAQVWQQKVLSESPFSEAEFQAEYALQIAL